MALQIANSKLLREFAAKAEGKEDGQPFVVMEIIPTFGTPAEVFYGLAFMTNSRHTRKDIVLTKSGKILDRKRHEELCNKVCAEGSAGYSKRKCERYCSAETNGLHASSKKDFKTPCLQLPKCFYKNADPSKYKEPPAKKQATSRC